MGEINNAERKDLFETRLIGFLLANVIKKDAFEGCNEIAAIMSQKTGKNVKGQTVHFINQGKVFAKKWFITTALEWALKEGWMPTDIKDWEHLIWTTMGKKQSALGGDNSKVYLALAELSGKPEILFENNYKHILDNNYG